MKAEASISCQNDVPLGQMRQGRLPLIISFLSCPSYAIVFGNINKYTAHIDDVSSHEFTGNTNDANDEYLRRDCIADVRQSSVHPVHDSELPRILQNRFTNRKIERWTTRISGISWYNQLLKTVSAGRMSTAVRLLASERTMNGVIQLDNEVEPGLTVRDKLNLLHPESGTVNPSLILTSPIEGARNHHSCVLLSIDAEKIRSTSKKIQGS
ncbi:hypothetical protein GJ496_008764 [Pomphorhynchus laevis]|nr:hypothetical protein GJ496_008764 [Pomphorhynchus laevis]